MAERGRDRGADSALGPALDAGEIPAVTLEHAVARYLERLAVALQALDPETVNRIVERLERARVQGATVFVLGNGGSASTASHFACDLAKHATADWHEPRLRAISLADNLALITAWANDADYSRVFAEPLDALVRPGDVGVAISTTGDSANVIAAARQARLRKATVIALTGRSGGAVRELADIWVGTPGDDMRQVEDVHLAICHAVTAALRLPGSAANGLAAGADHDARR